MKRITTALLILLALAASANAAGKWETMTFTDNVSSDIAALKSYCFTHDVKLEDVLWANKMDMNGITSGRTIFLPANHAELLAIWQHSGAWKPTALVPVTSGAAARRAVAPETPKPTPEPAPAPAPVAETPKPAGRVTPLPQKTDEDLARLLAGEPAPKPETPKPTPAPVAETPTPTPAPEPVAETPKQAGRVTPLPQKVDEDLARLLAEEQAPTPTPAPVAESPKPAPAPTPRPAPAPETPAKVIAQTAKPDKILTAKPKPPQPDIPGLADPIIVLSPNGDSSNGPMRLIISGDKVQVVRLPKSAAPKTPTAADALSGFGAPSGYAPYYRITPSRPGQQLIPQMSLSGKMMWPVDGKISSQFGWRGKRRHQGIDIPMPGGTPIRAAKDGIVVRTGTNTTPGFRGYGNFVMLDHGGSIKTFYAHCSRVAVIEGQRIMQGQVIGYVGSTGRSTANHLHFEVRINDTQVNPVPYLAGGAHFASTK